MSIGTDAARVDPYLAVLARLRGRLAGGGPLFVTAHEPGALYAAYLEALPAGLRQEHTCACCRRFTDRYGGLARLTDDGTLVPALWDESSAWPEPYRPAIDALARAVRRAKVERVAYLDEDALGRPLTVCGSASRHAGAAFDHFSVDVPEALRSKQLLATAGQRGAQSIQDFAMLQRALDDYPRAVIQSAVTLLGAEALYRSEKVEGAAKWFLRVREAVDGARRSGPARDHHVWRGVATAPPGFCHVRATMIGTLLDDLAAGNPVADVKRRFDAKMHPLLYQRPQAAPSAGNIAQAEKIVAELRAAGALARRLARLSDLPDVAYFWRPEPAPAPAAARAGVFAHLAAKAAKPAVDPLRDLRPTVMTWVKFQAEILPLATAIRYVVPPIGPFVQLTTAADPAAPPIYQWDHPERRNPVAWYIYPSGSKAEQWRLKAGELRTVVGVVSGPPEWAEGGGHAHHGVRLCFLLDGARDTNGKAGIALFPESLRSELHAIRATIEAFSRAGAFVGFDTIDPDPASGAVFSKGLPWQGAGGQPELVVERRDGATLRYTLDRWD
jgi:hypothetical protein